MGDPATQLSIEKELQKEDTRSLRKKIEDTHSEELIIGICGPIGTDMSFVASILKGILEEKYDYECEIIKMSKLIEGLTEPIEGSGTGFKRYSTLIDKGNSLRNKYRSSILADVAIRDIAANRESQKESKDDYRSIRKCYIIDSIKHQEEADLFRLIYSNIFYFFGVYTPVDIRVKTLKDKGLKEEEIYKLIDRDSGEEINHGQMVTKTFVESDFFLRVEENSKKAIEPILTRYLNLIFNSEIITPTTNETAMYLASSAAGNSACLSRQVGACITNSAGEVISVGWNDVPKVNGGVYQTQMKGEDNDQRCMHKGKGICYNDSEKKIIINELVMHLVQDGLVDRDKVPKLEMLIKKSRIKELIEFSRAVHAEMLAIINGSQKAGDKMIGGKLFCTTYPCHNCARHIIASGIKEVYYIEPYRKSLALKLHDDAITETAHQTEKVRILMFEGVSPRRYLDFFKMNGTKRKQDGVKISQSSKRIKPKNTLSLRAIPYLEAEVTEDLNNILS